MTGLDSHNSSRCSCISGTLHPENAHTVIFTEDTIRDAKNEQINAHCALGLRESSGLIARAITTDLQVLDSSLVGSDTYILKDECSQVEGTSAAIGIKCLCCSGCSEGVPKCSNCSCCCRSECGYTEG